MPPDKPRLPPPADALEGGAIEPVLTLFSSYNARTQRTALDELQRMYEARAASKTFKPDLRQTHKRHPLSP